MDDIEGVKLYKNIFTDDECTELVGLMLYKSTINWEVKTSKLDQTRSQVAFSNGKKSKIMYTEPMPISKNMEVFCIINSKIRDLLQNLAEEKLVEITRVMDLWSCYLYEDGSQSSPVLDIDFQAPERPVVILALGHSRHILIRSKKTEKLILKYKVEKGSVLCLFGSFNKHYTVQIPMEDCSKLHIQMVGGFSKFT